MDLALNNIQRLIGHKNQQTKPSFVSFIYLFIFIHLFIYLFIIFAFVTFFQFVISLSFSFFFFRKKDWKKKLSILFSAASIFHFLNLFFFL